MGDWTVHVVCDGGCRGNGGATPEAYGSFAIVRSSEVLFIQTDQYPELSTNNQAELQAVLVALKAIEQKVRDGGKADPHDVDIRVVTDSALAVGYFHGKNPWKRKEPTLRMIAAKIDLQKTVFKSVWINKTSRSEVNRVLGH
jgi:ribonuclease HI